MKWKRKHRILFIANDVWRRKMKNPAAKAAITTTKVDKVKQVQCVDWMNCIRHICRTMDRHLRYLNHTHRVWISLPICFQCAAKLFINNLTNSFCWNSNTTIAKNGPLSNKPDCHCFNHVCACVCVCVVWCSTLAAIAVCDLHYSLFIASSHRRKILFQ